MERTSSVLAKFASAFERPPLYAKTEIPFWDDEHISLQMLHAHLEPNFEGASRKLDFIEKSVDWISSILPPQTFPSVLDLGCGPGLYTERYAEKGYTATGVDLSRRSIRYARASAEEKGLPVEYLCQDYFHLSLGKEFDFATMIYCDFGALSAEDRALLLKIVYRHLKPGGKFLLDVFSLSQLEDFQESQTWEVWPDGGFWTPEKHLLLNRTYRYPGNAVLRQALVATDEKVSTYHLWDTYFSKDALEKELLGSGWRIHGYWGDVAGSEYTDKSPTIAILLEK